MIIEKLKPGSKKLDTFRIWPLVENLHFLPFLHETYWKKSPHEVIIFTKFHEDRRKIVDFLLLTKFWKCPVFFSSDFNFTNLKTPQQFLPHSLADLAKRKMWLSHEPSIRLFGFPGHPPCQMTFCTFFYCYYPGVALGISNCGCIFS